MFGALTVSAERLDGNHQGAEARQKVPVAAFEGHELRHEVAVEHPAAELHRHTQRMQQRKHF
jgi:hypothetical protein